MVEGFGTVRTIHARKSIGPNPEEPKLWPGRIKHTSTRMENWHSNMQKNVLFITVQRQQHHAPTPGLTFFRVVELGVGGRW